MFFRYRSGFALSTRPLLGYALRTPIVNTFATEHYVANNLDQWRTLFTVVSIPHFISKRSRVPFAKPTVSSVAYLLAEYVFKLSKGLLKRDQPQVR